MITTAKPVRGQKARRLFSFKKKRNCWSLKANKMCNCLSPQAVILRTRLALLANSRKE